MIEQQDKILITGAAGMVGSALVRCFRQNGYENLLVPTRDELDFTDQRAVRAYMQSQRPDVVIVAAAKVGGIGANMAYPADFMYINLMIATLVIHEAHAANVPRLLYLGSSCIYPRNAPQPISEQSLLTSPLEATNEAYALAKIAGVKMCEYYRKQYGRHYISAMPTNLYGPNDNYHLENAHVIAALISRFHMAKCRKDREVTIWGTGSALREFLYVDDLATACFYLLKHYDAPEPINIGSDDEVSIRQLADMIAEVVGYQGLIVNDLTKPDGTPRKKTNTERIYSLGWRPTVPLLEGLRKSYVDFIGREVLRYR